MHDDEQTARQADTCELAWPEQRRNLILFAVCTGLQYMMAPVLYVGITQASLCNRLGGDARLSNLPATLYFAMTAMPALLAWLSPHAAQLRRNLSLCYAVSGLMMGWIALMLSLPVSTSWKIAAVVIQGGVAGAVMPAAIALLWEAIGRGSAESSRGLALSLAFGLGPLLAVVGSFGQTALLGGSLFGWEFPGVTFPYGFIILFGMGLPMMAISAALAWAFVIPPEKQEVPRETVREVAGLLVGLPLMGLSLTLVSSAGGDGVTWQSLLGYLAGLAAAGAILHYFRSLLSQRVLLLATIVTILVYAGNVIPSNMNLYSSEALGDTPEKFAGVQNMLRFSFKVVAGLLLGWLLMKTSPRAGIVATSCIFLCSQIWAMVMTGPWYLVAFGLHGAGELVGVYAPNYIVSASKRIDLRKNMAFVTMLMVPAAPAGYLYGAIVDGVQAANWTVGGMSSEMLGFRISFLVCSLLIMAGIGLALTTLPAKPKPA